MPKIDEKKRQQNKANYDRRREELRPMKREYQRQKSRDAALGKLVRLLPTGARLINYGGNRWGVCLMHGTTATTRSYDPCEAIKQALRQVECWCLQSGWFRRS